MAQTDSGIRLELATYERGEVAKLLGVSVKHVARMGEAGKIPGQIRIGRLVRFRRVVIDQYLRGELDGHQSGAGSPS